MTRRSLPRPIAALLAGAALWAVSVGAAAAQQPDPWDFRAADLTRAQLQQVLARYDSAAQSPAYSARLRGVAQGRADSIRARLEAGDLREGDRLRLAVEGQASLSDTFTVVAGPALALPVVGTVGLKGALLSELPERLTAAVDNVYRGAAVRVELLTRIAVIGGVARPGFYALPREALVDDAISAAGGLVADGRLAEAYIERGRERVWPTDSLQAAMRQRRTIGDLGLEAGDRIVVPIVLPSSPTQTVQLVSYMVSVPLTLYTLIQLLK